MTISASLKPLDLRDELEATNMKGKNLTFLDDYSKEELGHLFKAAELLEPYSKNQIPLLANKILYTLFFQPSTRTRCSHEAAMHRLGGRVITETDPMGHSAMAKNESLYDGIRVISNRDVPVQSSTFLNFCNYGTYLMDDKGELIPLGSPVWVWGKFYVDVIQGILSGRLKRDKEGAGLNYWLGMDSDTIGIDFSDKLPQGLRTLAEILHDGMRAGAISPFRRRIVAQDGTVKNNDYTTTFTTEELIHMDWLVDNVCGSIPSFDELLPMSRNMVRELGIYKDEIPLQKEVKAVENPVHLR